MRTLWLAVTTSLLLLTACGDPNSTDSTPTGPGGMEHPEQPNELILQIAVGGGFVPVEFNLTELPAFSLYGDGKAIALGPQIAVYPAPALPNLQEMQVTEEGIQRILASALEAGLSGPDRSLENDRIADAPTTTFTVVAGGDTHTTAVYALGIDVDGPEDVTDQQEDRQRLRQFQQRATDLQQWLSADQISALRLFEPERMRLFVEPGAPDRPEPGLQQPELAWPLDVDLTAFGEPHTLEGYRCGVVAGADLQTLLSVAEGANQLTPWVSDGQTYKVLFRPLLPHESGCESF